MAFNKTDCKSVIFMCDHDSEGNNMFVKISKDYCSCKCAYLSVSAVINLKVFV